MLRNSALFFLLTSDGKRNIQKKKEFFFILFKLSSVYRYNETVFYLFLFEELTDRKKNQMNDTLIKIHYKMNR